MPNELPTPEDYMRMRRFRWWKEAFLAALTGLCAKSGAQLAEPNILLSAADIANRAGKYIMDAQEHFEVKGLIEPEGRDDRKPREVEVTRFP